MVRQKDTTNAPTAARATSGTALDAVYRGDGLRVWKGGASWTYFLYNGINIVRELDGDGDPEDELANFAGTACAGVSPMLMLWPTEGDMRLASDRCYTRYQNWWSGMRPRPIGRPF